MTPDIPVGPDPISDLQNERSGMTVKVVRGSIWAFAGMAAPLAVSFFTTPIVIRLLGTESYGVLALVTVIPTYIAFSDLGMNLASTKFGSEAFAKGSPEHEARLIRTSAMIGILTALPVALALAFFSGPILSMLRVPDALRPDAASALGFAAAAFFFNVLSGIFSSPQLARLRIGVNAAITATSRILGLAAVPVVIYLGGGISGAFFALMIASLLAGAANLFVSRRLLPALFKPGIAREAIGPLLRFGAPVATSLIASALLLNLEKSVLARVASVETLAYYSVAFTFTNLAAIFSQSMIQPLMPAFSQLAAPEKRDELNALFRRAVRLNLAVVIPLIFVMFAFAVPIFTVWAGPDFGVGSTPPFYLLLVGLVFNLVVYIPSTLLISFGKTASIAKVHWLELFPYIGLTAILSSRYGAAGAAAAWSLRAAADCILIAWLARKKAGVTPGLRLLIPKFGIAILIILPAAIVVLLAQPALSWLFAIVPATLCLLAYHLWTHILTPPERTYLLTRLRRPAQRY